MEKVYGIIYKTTCLVNGKIYIGQTTCLNKKSYLGSGTLISAAIKKYGRENFVRETLIECYNQTELDEWEHLLIWEYKSRDRNVGYNIAKGSVMALGESNHSKLPEVRAKMSMSRIGNTNSKFLKHTNETKDRISKSLLGRKLSKECKIKISESRIGNKNYKSKVVCQFDKLGNFIHEYESCNIAEIITGINNISDCCLYKRKSAGGYIWKYK